MEKPNMPRIQAKERYSTLWRAKRAITAVISICIVAEHNNTSYN